MPEEIRTQGFKYVLFYILFAAASLGLIWYYLSDTIIHFTTGRQFPINSISRFPLSILILPAELFSFSFAMYFVFNLLTDRRRNPIPEMLEGRDKTSVAFLIPVYNEPEDIVESTIVACKHVVWRGGKRIYLLDDSTNPQDRKNMEALAKRHGCALVRRPDRAGYKAGNINNAVKNHVKEDFFVILDSDQAPKPEFLEKTMDYFSDPKAGFVQTPQHFKNDSTAIERAAKVGTNIFYHAQCVSKASDGAMPFCGTNAIIRKESFQSVNGFSYYTATEDVDLGLRMNEQGFHGVYVPMVLVEGYAPVDFAAYSSQQYRWANGNLAILRESWHKILFGKQTLVYQIHTLFTLGWWLIGLVTLAYVVVPLLSLIFGMGTHHTWLPTSLLVLLYFNVVLGIGMIYFSLRSRLGSDKVTIRDALLQYILITNSMFIYSKAAVAALFKRYVGFIRTNKSKGHEQRGWSLIKWNLLLSLICYAASMYSLFNAAIASTPTQMRTYLPISLWLLFYSVILAASILFVDLRFNTSKRSARA